MRNAPQRAFGALQQIRRELKAHEVAPDFPRVQDTAA
jgi:hypothetical protein